MKKRKQTNSNTELVATAISNLCIPYLRKYKDKIIGIYLSPYTVGGKQKIEVVITQKGNESFEVSKKTTKINELQIFMAITSINNYKSSPKTNEEYRLSKDLKTGIIIYDTKETLKSRQNGINKNESIAPFYNTIELPDNLRIAVKNKVYAYNKKKH